MFEIWGYDGVQKLYRAVDTEMSALRTGNCTLLDWSANQSGICPSSLSVVKLYVEMS